MSRKPRSPTPPGPRNQQGIGLDEAVARAQAHWNAGQTDQAELLCQQVLAVWPGHADASHLLGVISHAYGNLDLALDYLRRACQAPRAPAVYLSNLAEMCRQRGLLAEGETAGRRAVALDAGLIGGWNNLGIVLQEAGKYEESLACLERVIALSPDYAEAHNNLGNTLNRLGRLDRAQGHYQRALALKPNYAEAHGNLVKLLNDLGEPDEALISARRAIDCNPRHGDAYINAAAVEIARGRHAEALRWLDSLLSFAPGHAGALAARSGALKHLNRDDEALDSARRAVALAPDNQEANNALGQALQALGRFEEALTVYERSATLPSLQPETALVNKAVLLMEVGRTEEARVTFDQALVVNPRSTAVWFNRADLKTFKADDTEIGRMETLLASGDVQSRCDRMSLHFALGKAWLDAGDADRAFAHLGQGNRMKRAAISFNAEASVRWLDAIAEAFPADLFARHAGGGEPSDLPVFIVGIPRSGTTLLEQILASHSQVHGAGELKVVSRMVEQAMGSDHRPLGFPQLVSSLLPGDPARMGRHYLAAVSALAPGSRRVVDKMPANFLYAGLIHLMLPNARIIHCHRDPVDTCLSCYTKLFSDEQAFTYDQAELGRFYRGYETLMAHWRAVLPPDRFIEVEYEQVVADIETQARRMIAFSGLEWQDSCLEFHKSRRPVKTASVNQVRQPIYRGSVGRWKPYERHLGPLLAALEMANRG